MPIRVIPSFPPQIHSDLIIVLSNPDKVHIQFCNQHPLLISHLRDGPNDGENNPRHTQELFFAGNIGEDNGASILEAPSCKHGVEEERFRVGIVFECRGVGIVAAPYDSLVSSVTSSAST